MSEGDLLLQAVLANPEENSVRLVFADWLEENGEPARAELIRLQVQLINHPIHHKAETGCPLRRREKALLDSHPEWSSLPCRRCGGCGRTPCPDCIHWKGRVPPTCRCGGSRRTDCSNCGGSGNLLKTTYRPGYDSPMGDRLLSWVRGFINSVSLTLAEAGEEVRECFVCGEQLDRHDYCARCDASGRRPVWKPSPLAVALVRALPLTDLPLVGLTPYHNGTGYCWYNGARTHPYATVPEAANLPTSLFRLFGERERWVSYPTEGAAITALGQLVCRSARREAGLPMESGQ